MQNKNAQPLSTWYLLLSVCAWHGRCAGRMLCFILHFRWY